MRGLMRWPLATLLLAGLLLAGSDGMLFPWPNLAGVGMLLMFAAIMRREGRVR